LSGKIPQPRGEKGEANAGLAHCKPGKKQHTYSEYKREKRGEQGIKKKRKIRLISAKKKGGEDSHLHTAQKKRRAIATTEARNTCFLQLRSGRNSNLIEEVFVEGVFFWGPSLLTGGRGKAKPAWGGEGLSPFTMERKNVGRQVRKLSYRGGE